MIKLHLDRKEAVKIMFSQKKKKSKLWIVIPVVLALGCGLWLNADFENRESSGSGTENPAVEADSDQYEDIEDISDLSGVTDARSDQPSPERQQTESADGEETYESSGRQETSADFPETDDTGKETGGVSSPENLQEASGNDQEIGRNDTESDSGRESDNGYGGGIGKIVLRADPDGTVIVYRYDTDGAVVSQTETEIHLSLLTETDQQFFTRGVTLNSESELSELLQDFEG